MIFTEGGLHKYDEITERIRKRIRNYSWHDKLITHSKRKYRLYILFLRGFSEIEPFFKGSIIFDPHYVGLVILAVNQI